MAENGEWDALLAEALQDHTVAEMKAMAAVHKPLTQDRRVALACRKLRCGCKKGAANILIGRKLLPPSPATRDAVLKL